MDPLAVLAYAEEAPTLIGMEWKRQLMKLADWICALQFVEFLNSRFRQFPDENSRRDQLLWDSDDDEG